MFNEISETEWSPIVTCNYTNLPPIVTNSTTTPTPISPPPFPPPPPPPFTTTNYTQLTNCISTNYITCGPGDLSNFSYYYDTQLNKSVATWDMLWRISLTGILFIRDNDYFFYAFAQ